MGVFDFLKGKNNNDREETRVIDGYEIGVDSGKVYHCPRGLTEYKLPIEAKSLTNQACIDMNATAESIIIPPSFKTFDSKDLLALNSAKKLRNLQFPDGIEDIDPTRMSRDVAFNVPKSVKHLKAHVYESPKDGRLVIGEHVSSIGTYFASHDCSIQSVEVSGSVEKIGDGAFNQCRNIQSVVLHKGVKECGKDAFKGTNKLQLVELPEGFSGRFDAAMEYRTVSSKHMGKETRYDAADFEKESDATLTINVEHSGQKYSFNIRRGDFTDLSLDENNIKFNDGVISCDFSKLDPRAIHTIKDGKMVSVLPPKIEQQQKVEQLRETLGGGSYQVKPQMQQKPTKTLEKQDFTKYNLNTVNKVISDICERAGFSDPSEFVGEDLSFEDEINLTIALHARNCLLKDKLEKNPNDDTPRACKKSSQLIKELEQEQVIHGWTYLAINDKKNDGKYLKMFESKMKELSNDRDR